MATISFTLARRQFDLSDDDVRRRIAQHRPDPIDQYWIEIDGVRWPVKQVMALATGLSKSDFQSQNSRRLLAKFGFVIGRGNAEPVVTPTKPPSSTSAPRRVRRVRTHFAVDVVLVGCVKTKLSGGASAKDLYTSDYFAKMRAYAEGSGYPWFILSAEHGLVSPDDWLEPYDCYLPDTSREYRRAWGQKVASQLEAALGPLAGVALDVHAGSAYVQSVRLAVEPLGAVVVDQLEGLSFGRRLSWYLQPGAQRPGIHDVVSQLRDPSGLMSLGDFLATRGEHLRSPGMYSWWVDEAGAQDLSRGLGHTVGAGLVYAGLAGATRKGGSTSSSTLWERIATMHLSRRHGFSTLRWSLGSILANAHGLPAIDEVGLTQWMHAHMRVVAIPVDDPDILDDLETEILTELDPPLNLAKVSKTPLRTRLSALRKQYGGGGADTGDGKGAAT